MFTCLLVYVTTYIMLLPESIQSLINALERLPGIGPKSAQRIAFYLLSVEPPDIDRLVAVLGKVRDGVRFCVICGNVSDDERCRICADPRRDGSLVCVVEEPKDIQAVERTREFRGRYHVLGGALDPLSGVGPEQLRIRELLTRIGARVATRASQIWSTPKPRPAPCWVIEALANPRARMGRRSRCGSCARRAVPQSRPAPRPCIR